jgi:hypothetical protein
MVSELDTFFDPKQIRRYPMKIQFTHVPIPWNALNDAVGIITEKNEIVMGPMAGLSEIRRKYHLTHEMMHFYTTKILATDRYLAERDRADVQRGGRAYRLNTLKAVDEEISRLVSEITVGSKKYINKRLDLLVDKIKESLKGFKNQKTIILDILLGLRNLIIDTNFRRLVDAKVDSLAQF